MIRLLARIFGKMKVRYTGEEPPHEVEVTFILFGKIYPLYHKDGSLLAHFKNLLKREKQLADKYLAKVKAENADKK